MKITFGSLLYWIPIILLLSITVFLVFFTRNKSKKFNYYFIFTLSLVNFVLHFLKIFLPTYDYWYDIPYSFARISFENICAVSVLLFPILYLLKNKYVNDALVFICLFSAIAAYIAPTSPFTVPLDSPANIIEVIRYYFCHFPLFACPILMLTNHLHRVSYRRVFVVGLFFLANNTIIFLNALALKGSGVISCTWEQFFSRNYANPGLIFGPNKQIYDAGFKYISMLVPNFLKYTTSSGDLGYIPVLWYITPLFFIGVLLTIVLMIFQHKEVKKDYYFICAKCRLLRISYERNKSKKE